MSPYVALCHSLSPSVALCHPLVSLVAQANADEVKVRVSKEEAQVGEIAKEAQAIAADAQRDLDEAMPCQAT